MTEKAPPLAVSANKAALRQEARDRRKSLRNRSQSSEKIIARLKQLPEWQAARGPLIYLAAGSEVDTWPLVRELLAKGTTSASSRKRLIIPWCDGDHLSLFRLTDESELETGSFGIREPSAFWRNEPHRRPENSSIDLVIVPGLAFDAAGHRLGQGKGYYDRLLAELPGDTIKIGLAFEAQI
ncbi:MAG: 5-formyltetrahydrofolate cyclo-ligase, partial [Planctomyces sp.]|nr:5-formyltetrahydrofolate cyclo-ligase [Planctomyces sp.]